MHRRPRVSTQVGAPVAAASLAVGGAYLGVDLRVGIPLLCIGVVVTCWIVWETLHEGRARRAVAQLIVAASRRLAQHENPDAYLALDQALDHFNREAEWVAAALGHMEARLLLDTRQHPAVPSLSGTPDPVATHLRGFRANLLDLHKRFASLDIERDFKPSDWEDRL